MKEPAFGRHGRVCWRFLTVVVLKFFRICPLIVRKYEAASFGLTDSTLALPNLSYAEKFFDFSLDLPRVCRSQLRVQNFDFEFKK